MNASIKLAQISTDTELQPRENMSTDLVAEYADRITEGDKFPPVVVFADGGKYWLADGYHRLAAYRQLEFIGVLAEIRQGTKRDAILYSVGANADHGQRRTNADKHRAVMTLLNDPEWSNWSDREIARRCAVDNSFVSRLRKSLTVDEPQSEQQERTYTTKHGTTATMNTSNIGRRESIKDVSRVEDIPNRFTPDGSWPDDKPEPPKQSEKITLFDPTSIRDIPEDDFDDPQNEPDTGHATYEYTEVEDVIDSINRYIDIILGKTDPAIHHAVIVEAIKLTRRRGVELEQVNSI